MVYIIFTYLQHERQFVSRICIQKYNLYLLKWYTLQNSKHLQYIKLFKIYWTITICIKL